MSNPLQYTVGWISALPTESVAAQQFLDERHEGPESVAQNDNNVYTLGRVGRHNVVMAVLPKGEYGTTTAATVARDMLHSFPNVRIGLMVGIGGGAPSWRHDIRLGDIVVSTPQGSIGGGFQYDYGKTIQDQAFHYTGFLDKPPTVLRALAGLRAKYALEGHQLGEQVAQILEKKPRLRKNYSRPQAMSDRLYLSHIVHPSDSSKSCTEVCDDNPEYLVDRPERREEEDDPAIHYGLIASGNQLMKDARIRDKLAAENDVLCFEMEAAGLMNHFPCLIIRGICDYSDSHKNKEWQGFAAMMAAAYATDLLRQIAPGRVEGERKIGDILSGRYEIAENHGDIAMEHRDIAEVQLQGQKDQAKDKLPEKEVVAGSIGTQNRVTPQLSRDVLDCLMSLAFPGMNEGYYDVADAVTGTCEWLLQHNSYMQWTLHDHGLLWIKGAPGSGKSTLLRYIVDNYEVGHGDLVLSFFFQGHRDRLARTPLGLFRSLLSQVLGRAPDTLPELVDIFKKRCLEIGEAGEKWQWHQKELWGFLELCLPRVLKAHSVWLFIDGLDECGEDNAVELAENFESLSKSLSKSLKSFNTKFHICFTSRHYPNLDFSCRFEIWLERENKVAISTYVASQLSEFRLRTSSEISDLITDRARGVFLWAHLAVRNVLELERQGVGSKEIEAAVYSSPRGLDELLLATSEAEVDSKNNYRTLPSLNDTDVQSEISDISGASTVNTALTALTAYTAVSTAGNDPLQAAATKLADFLFQDPDLQPLYSQVIREFGDLRFSSNHNKLLRIFIEDLRRSANSPMLEQAMDFLGQKRLRAQVTARIRRLNALESSHLVENQNFSRILDQKEDRDYTLNRLLSQQRVTSGTTEHPKHHDEDKTMKTDYERAAESEISDEDGEQDDSRDDEVGEFPLLDSIFKFLAAGPPLQTLKSNLDCFVNPPTTISEALDKRNIRALRRLLRKQFDSIAQDNYSWLRELEDLGHTRDEIAQLLLEEASDSPWIYLTLVSESTLVAEVQPLHHIPGCVHKLSSISDWVRDATSFPIAADVGDSSPPLAEIQLLCGLGGIIPSTRDQEKWNGSVTFKEENTIALISFAHPDPYQVISRIINALENFHMALGLAQSAGLCCESFTILRPNRVPREDSSADSQVEVYRVYFWLVVEMLKEIRLSNNPDAQDIKVPAVTQLLEDLFPGIRRRCFPLETGTTTNLHLCCLSVQLLCLGFQSYLVAHVGPLRLPFLDTPIKKIQLLGSQTTPGPYPIVEANLKALTCIGDMLQGPVLVFSPFQLEGHASEVLGNPALAQFDLLASPEDLIDTWGPGQFVVPITQSKLPSAIRICGGFIYESDRDRRIFHWCRYATPGQFCQGELDPRVKIRIGAHVTVNDNCRLDEGQHRGHCSNLLHSLDTHPPGWILAEKQFGFQGGGDFALLHVTAGYHRYPGRTLKQSYLDRPDEELVTLLEDYWGVQVSLCTGIARRVSLRAMVADLLPIFAASLTRSEDCVSWESLERDHSIHEAFRRDNLKLWLRNLNMQLYGLVLRGIRGILDALRKTGLDQERKSLLVSWPYSNDMLRCFRIDLGQRESSWARLIADSEDCATFAYVSPKCLETPERRCRGPDGLWCNSIPLLETAVMTCSAPSPAQTATIASRTLLDGQRYYFGKLGRTVVVKAVKSNAMVARLESSEIPDRFMYRMHSLKGRLPMLRERRILQEHAEIVTMLASNR